MSVVPSLEELRSRCLNLTEEAIADAISEEGCVGDDWQPTIAKSLMRCCESCCKKFHKVYKVWQYYGGKDAVLAWREYSRAGMPVELSDDELSSPELQKTAVVIRLLMEEEVLRFENPMLAHRLAVFASKLADRLSPRRGLIAVNGSVGPAETPLAVVALARVVNSFRYSSQRQGAGIYLRRLESAADDMRVPASVRAEAIYLLGTFYAGTDNSRANRYLRTAYNLYIPRDPHLAGVVELSRAYLARINRNIEPLERLKSAASLLNPWRDSAHLYCRQNIALALLETGQLHEAIKEWSRLPTMPSAVSENMRVGLGGALNLGLGNLSFALHLLDSAIAEFERLGQWAYAAVYVLYCCECHIENRDYKAAQALLRRAHLYLADEPEPPRPRFLAAGIQSALEGEKWLCSLESHSRGYKIYP